MFFRTLGKYHETLKHFQLKKISKFRVFKDPDDHEQIGSARKIQIFIFEIEKSEIVPDKR